MLPTSTLCRKYVGAMSPPCIVDGHVPVSHLSQWELCPSTPEFVNQCFPSTASCIVFVPPSLLAVRPSLECLLAGVAFS